MTINSPSNDDLFREFLKLLNQTEVSDSDRVFRPNYISSCRVLDGKRLGEILNELERRLSVS